MAQAHRLLEIDSLAVGDSRCVTVADQTFGVFHQPDGFHVIDNKCPHKGAPLHEGFVVNGAVACPWHQWEFRLTDGHCLSVPSQAVKSYPVTLRDGGVWVEL